MSAEIFLNAIKRNIAEKELVESENKFRSLVEQITDGIIFYNFNTKKILWANKAYCDFSGYTTEELKELYSFDIVAHEKESILELDGEIIKNRKYFIGERKHRGKDGNTFDVEVNSALIDLNDTEVMVVVVRDLTPRKISEQSIRDSEEQYRTLYSTMAQGVVYQDNHGIITSANSAACKILKTGLDELIGHSSFSPFLNPIHEDGTPFKREEYPSCVSIHTGKSISNVILGFQYQDSSELRWIVINSVPEFKAGDEISYRVFSTFTDITEQKKTEVFIRKSEEELKKINASKDKFFSIVAHDLKSPFLGLLGFTNALLENFDDLGKEQMRRYITNINKTTKNVYNLIQHLLEWSRIQTKHVEIIIEQVSPFNCVEYAINLLIANAANKEITIINNTNKLALVAADERLLNSIVENLISNAIKFSNRNSKVIIVSRKNGSLLEISIQDNGIGMDEESKKNLFRLDINSSTYGTEGEAGTGLGLILCKDMIESMNGQIWVESEVGKGSIFYISLPVA